MRWRLQDETPPCAGMVAVREYTAHMHVSVFREDSEEERHLGLTVIARYGVSQEGCKNFDSLNSPANVLELILRSLQAASSVHVLLGSCCVGHQSASPHSVTTAFRGALPPEMSRVCRIWRRSCTLIQLGDLKRSRACRSWLAIERKRGIAVPRVKQSYCENR